MINNFIINEKSQVQYDDKNNKIIKFNNYKINILILKNFNYVIK